MVLQKDLCEHRGFVSEPEWAAGRQEARLWSRNVCNYISYLYTFYSRPSQVRSLAAVGTMHLDNWFSTKLGRKQFSFTSEARWWLFKPTLWKRHTAATFEEKCQQSLATHAVVTFSLTTHSDFLLTTTHGTLAFMWLSKYTGLLLAARVQSLDWELQSGSRCSVVGFEKQQRCLETTLPHPALALCIAESRRGRTRWCKWGDARSGADGEGGWGCVEGLC